MKKIYYTILGWIRGDMFLIGKHSADALSSFESTLNSLKAIEVNIAKTVDKKQAKADALPKHIAQLAATKEKNGRIANKISEFLND
jgi:hypothetical protein